MASVIDPVCGKPVDALRARAVGIFHGVTHYFCSPECKAEFAAGNSGPVELVSPSSVEVEAEPPPAEEISVQRAAPIESRPAQVRPILASAPTSDSRGAGGKLWIAVAAVVAVLSALIAYAIR